MASIGHTCIGRNDDEGPLAQLEEWRDGAWVGDAFAVAGDPINLDAKPYSGEEAQRII